MASSTNVFHILKNIFIFFYFSFILHSMSKRSEKMWPTFNRKHLMWEHFRDEGCWALLKRLDAVFQSLWMQHLKELISSISIQLFIYVIVYLIFVLYKNDVVTSFLLFFYFFAKKSNKTYLKFFWVFFLFWTKKILSNFSFFL